MIEVNQLIDRLELVGGLQAESAVGVAHKRDVNRDVLDSQYEKKREMIDRSIRRQARRG